MKFPFVGPSYVYNSKNFDAQRSINLYPVKSETGTSKSIAALMGTPGLLDWTLFPTLPIRQCWNANGRVFFVGGNQLYEVFIDKSFTARGQLSTSTGPVSMCDNGTQIIIVDGPNGYIFNLGVNSFTNITMNTGWLGADTVTFLGGYFVLNKPDSGIYYISGLYDGTSYDPLDFATAEGSPDNLVAVKAVHDQVWLFGDTSVQVAYNQGGALFPLSVIQGALIVYGCAAAQSVAQTSNTLFWLGQDADGGGVVWMANGFQPQRISTDAIEFYLQQYTSYLPQAVAYTYQENGNYFYCLNVPTMPTTLVYEVGTQQWHERAFFSNGAYSRHRAQCHVYAFGLHLVGDYQSGQVYSQSLNYYDDAGQIIRRQRAAPHLADDLEYMYYSKFQLDMQTGVGLQPGYLVTGLGSFDAGFSSGFDIGGNTGVHDINPDSDPQILLQFSDDGGHVWSNNVQCAVGKIGKYRTRAIWRRLGRSRDRIFRVTFTPRCQVFFIDAHIDLERGSN